MQLFYASLIHENSCILSEEESWHCIKVLRSKVGDTIHLTDGKGSLYEGRLVNIQSKGCIIEIFNTTHPNCIKSWKIHIAMAPPKNADRFEWFLEKATEIGIDEITPIKCDHSERESVNMRRLEKVLITAMKQSLRTVLPTLNEPEKFRTFISHSFEGQKFIGYCNTENDIELHEVYQPGRPALIMIGPEGDFSPDEIALAKENGYTAVHLGKSRLRTETAGIVACHTLELLNQMNNRKS
ncbi:MAG: 16S rRNA (uracil(1498)-N(3))-methyltransferase [Bacteroidales bacterium]|nr:16S rRNA (uracil(1498)-N(3))-methyltransferase [Bacteroidales bacterium]